MVFKYNKKICPTGGGENLKIESPFSLGQAFKFGFAFTIILVIASFANQIAGTIGI